MVSITDCVVEGLKYPFGDVKKLLSFGVLFAILNLLAVVRGKISFQIFRTTGISEGNLTSLSLSQLPAGDTTSVIILLLISFIIFLIVMGYEYNVVKFSIDKRQELPGFNEILDILVKGIKYFIVTLAYNIIPAAVLAISLISLTDQVYIGILISMILFIIAFFILIMALNNMIAHDSIRKAFDFREIFDNIANLGWGKYIGIILFTMIIFVIIMVAVAFILSVITVIFTNAVNNQAIYVSAFMGIVEGLFVTSYGGIFFNRVFGSVYREAVK